ncbi:hypothetical protein H3C70_05400 [Patescibacteria group bacterium]|nr:hypothetical protein [Patescibacteria group bacterium]
MNTTNQKVQAQIDKLKAQAQEAAADVRMKIMETIDELQAQLNSDD